MPMVVTTKDSASLSDLELAELADLSAQRSPSFDIGFLSKEKEEWVLVTYVHEGNKLRGYSFCTLERIGGTPSLLIGLAAIDRTTKAEPALKAIMMDQYRRALLAFPDEDVLVGTRLISPDGFRIFTGLHDIMPFPGQKPTGEDRAWATRLAKRFTADGCLDDRTFIIKGEGEVAGCIDFLAAKLKLPEGVDKHFEALDAERGDRLVVFGWALAEDLSRGKLGR